MANANPVRLSFAIAVANDPEAKIFFAVEL
jgi:hypothetical protein